jgi:hypothetical protein
MGRAAQYALVYPNAGGSTEKGFFPGLTSEQVFV